MLHALSVLAAATEAGHEKSKIPFYLCGGLLTVWAIVLSAIGMSRATFPTTSGAARGVMALSAVLMVAAMATAVLTG